MLRKLIVGLLLACCTLPVRADEPFVMREEPPVYPGGVEQLREDLARQTALHLVRQAEYTIRQRRMAKYPDGVPRPYALVYVDVPTLRSELGGWLLPEDPVRWMVAVGFTVTEKGTIADARLLATPAVDLGEAVLAATAHCARWLPGKWLTDDGWRAAPFPFIVMVRTGMIMDALESVLREREKRERESEKRKREWEGKKDEMNNGRDGGEK